MKIKLTYLAIIFISITIISIFLPWVEVTSSATVSSSYGSTGDSVSSGGLAGIMVWDGILALILSAVALFLSIKRFKWTYFIGILLALIGFAHLFGWIGFNSDVNFDSSYGNVSGSVDIVPLYGLYIFLASSIAFVTISLPIFNKNEYQPIFGNKEYISICPKCGNILNFSTNNEWVNYKCQVCGTLVEKNDNKNNSLTPSQKKINEAARLERIQKRNNQIAKYNYAIEMSLILAFFFCSIYAFIDIFFR